MRLVWTTTFLAALSGCGDLELDDLELDLLGPGIEFKEITLSFHIRKGGNGKAKIEFIRITPEKSGEQGKKDIAKFMDDFEKSDECDFFEEYGLKNRKIEIQSGPNDSLNAFAEGEFEDVFMLVKALDSSKPFRLRKEKPVSILWDGKVLDVAIGKENAAGKQVPQKPSDSGPVIVFKLTTEGRFAPECTGEVSKDQKTLVFRDTDALERLRFRITGLAEN